jgi:hypothetical protein
MSPETGQILIYQDGGLNLQVRLEGQSVWLTQRLIAELFGVTVPTVNEHLANIYDERELDSAATIRNFRIVQTEGSRQVSRQVEHYNLDAILAVGYRVRSPIGTAFRQWATARLSELLVKGFTLDDERIKAGRTIGGDYFEELLAHPRHPLIRTAVLPENHRHLRHQHRLRRQGRDHAVVLRHIQNKLHWAIHGHTAAEIVRLRADAAKPHMGLTTWKNAPAGSVGKADVVVSPKLQIKL